METVVVLADAELVTVTFLRTALAARGEAYAAGVRVGTFVDPAPLPFVQIRRVGGTQLTHKHDVARIDVLTWHTNDQNRMNLAQLCRSLLRASIHDAGTGGTVMFLAEFTGPTQVPDPADPSKRVVLFTHELIVR